MISPVWPCEQCHIARFASNRTMMKKAFDRIKGRPIMGSAPQAGLEGGAVSYESAGDARFDGNKPDSMLPDLSAKPTDEEELGDTSPLSPEEAAANLPPWYQQVSTNPTEPVPASGCWHCSASAAPLMPGPLLEQCGGSPYDVTPLTTSRVICRSPSVRS